MKSIHCWSHICHPLDFTRVVKWSLCIAYDLELIILICTYAYTSCILVRDLCCHLTRLQFVGEKKSATNPIGTLYGNWLWQLPSLIQSILSKGHRANGFLLSHRVVVVFKRKLVKWTQCVRIPLSYVFMFLHPSCFFSSLDVVNRTLYTYWLVTLYTDLGVLACLY